MAIKNIALQVIALCGVLLSLAMTPAMAGLYDNTATSPGTVISNQIQLTYGKPGTDRPPMTADTEFTVVPITVPGKLNIFGYAPGNPDAVNLRVRPSTYSTGADGTGPFMPVPAPVMNGLEIPLGQPLPLVQIERLLRGMPFFLVLEDAGLNFDSALLDTVDVTITDFVTGDTEVIRLTETSSDSGIFTAHSCACGTDSSARDGSMTTVPHSLIDAVYTDALRAERRLDDSVLVGPVDPFGIIFDSRTGAPINGVEITIIDNATGNPARVYGNDLNAVYPATVITGSTVTDSAGETYVLADGEYRFPFVDIGTYHFEVTAPRGYVAPSVALDEDIQALDDAPYALNPGSRLGDFDVVPGPALEIDIPMDGAQLIDIIRTGSADILEIGDFIQYTVSVGSTSSTPVQADVLDILPQGINILTASVSVDDVNFTDAIISADGRRITFPNVIIPVSGRLEITYIAQVTTGARENATLVSSSVAEADTMISNTDTHDLNVTAALSMDENIVLGQVFTQGCDAHFDPTLDLSGIRIMMENGRYVETDSEGLFSFRAMRRGTHVLQMDPLSIPRGFKPVLCENNTRRAGSATSIFVEARGGLMNQVAFFLEGAPVFDEAPTTDTVETPARIDDFGQEWLENQPSVAPGIVFPQPGALPVTKSMNLAYIRQAGQSATVTINGEKVPAFHRRPAIAHADGVSFLDVWRGAALKEGHNEIVVTVVDISGETVFEETRTVSYASEVNQIEIIEERSVLTSDGRSQPYLVLQARNRDGIILHPGAIISLQASHPFLFAPDADEAASRRASFMVDADGYIRASIASTTRPGRLTVSVEYDGGIASDSVGIETPDRPWMLVGLAQGTAAHSTIADHMQTIEESRIAEFGDISVNGRVAFYAQGVIEGKWLATIRYDSGISEQENDFFAEDPDARYVVYGDVSTEGDAAQSRDALYLRLESEDMDLLYGDFDTGFNTGQATYSRRLTGARAILQGEATKVIVFAASTSQSFVEDDFAGNGTSGPFDLSSAPVAVYSERVYIETYDRRQTDQILSSIELERGRDYDIDYGRGRIFLLDPLMSRDTALNPNSLVVRYEIDNIREDGIVAGARIEHQLTDDILIGATAVHEDNINGSTASGQLLGIDAEITINPFLTAQLSAAASRQGDTDALDSDRMGHAAEARLIYDDDRSIVEAYLRSESTGFGIDNKIENPEQIVSAGIKADIVLDEYIANEGEDDEMRHARRLELAAVAEDNLDSNERIAVAEGMFVREDGYRLRGFGLRALHRTTEGGEADDGAWGLKGIAIQEWVSSDERLRLGFGQELTLFKDGDIGEPDRGSMEISYALTESLWLNATNEILIEDGIEANIVSLGADIDAWEGGTLSFGGLNATSPSTSAIIGYAGLDQDIVVNETLAFNFGVEHQGVISSTVEENGPVANSPLSHERLTEGFTAFRFGVDKTTETYSAQALAERRLSDSVDSTRLSFRMEGDHGENAAYGLKGSFYREDPAAADRNFDHEVQASYAYRPKDARRAILNQLTFGKEGEGDTSQTRIVNLLSYSTQLGETNELNLRHGIKWAEFEFGGDSYSDVLNMVGAEYRHDISEWIDIGLHGSALHAARGDTMRYSAGVSVGVTPFENGWLSIGYNAYGYEDRDFSASGYTDKGAFVQFRVKFDGDTLRALTR
jgi:uncharacterized repeat protein (TIGR01451 family)